mgnify:CR=1 FL=1
MAHIHEKIDFTVAIFVVDAGRVLLVLHRKLKKWLPLGGHIELDEDPEIAALREAREETGVAGVHPVSPAIFDVDRHWIPDRPGEPGHWHQDLRFLLEADRDAPLVVSSESKDLAWVALDDLSTWRRRSRRGRGGCS